MAKGPSFITVHKEWFRSC